MGIEEKFEQYKQYKDKMHVERIYTHRKAHNALYESLADSFESYLKINPEHKVTREEYDSSLLKALLRFYSQFDPQVVEKQKKLHENLENPEKLDKEEREVVLNALKHKYLQHVGRRGEQVLSEIESKLKAGTLKAVEYVGVFGNVEEYSATSSQMEFRKFIAYKFREEIESPEDFAIFFRQKMAYKYELPSKSLGRFYELMREGDFTELYDQMIDKKTLDEEKEKELLEKYGLKKKKEKTA